METRTFRSVKEAVALYGKRILAPELYANVLEEMEIEAIEHENYLSKIKAVSMELEEAKENLERAKERSMAMAHSLSSLQEEIEMTKRKLQLLKEQEFERRDSEIQDVEIVEVDPQKFDSEEESEATDGNSSSSARVGVEMFRNGTSVKKKKVNKSSMYMMGGIFSRKK